MTTIMSPGMARAMGHTLVRQGFAIMNRGTIRPVHIRVTWDTTLCGKTLSEPNRIGQDQYLGQFNLCAACARKAS